MAWMDGSGTEYLYNAAMQYFREKTAAYKRFVHIPRLQMDLGKKAQSATIRCMNTFTGYGEVVMRYKAGSDPGETDPVFDPDNGITVTESGDYYVRAFPVGESIYGPSPAAIASFTKAVLQTLPTPSISVSRTSSTQGRVTISNTSSYPSGTMLVINGTSYSMTSSVTLSIGTTATTVTVYATYNGDEYYESQSATASRTISEYVPTCATPSISFSSSTNRVTITCSTSGATIYYRRGTSGSYSVYSGSFTISSSTTIYAYATKSGYNTSGTTSRYCSYTAPTPSLPTPSFSISNYSYDRDDLKRTVYFRFSNKDAFPDGTSFTLTYHPVSSYNSDQTSTYTKSNFPSMQTFNDGGIYGDWSITLRASCTGYISSSITASP